MNADRIVGVALLVLVAFFVQSFITPQAEAGFLSLDEILAGQGIELPVVWGELGEKLIASGVIDQQKLKDLYGDESVYREFIEPKSGKVRLTRQSAAVFLNFLWALGLGNKNSILETGEMATSETNLANFASTGGWTLSTTTAMDHYSKHEFIKLDATQQRLLTRISRTIFRPCCNNSTHFPDCNHGMAMLGLLELGISQGFNEDELYSLALAANAYWFEGTYRVIDQYFVARGMKWQEQSPKLILSEKYSSASGFQKIQASMQTQKNQQGPSCGVK
ncbi:MAG: hypothetical protein A3H72_00755 [Candidatus Doudnabacteria bacterium RIFCSPLOWO2_02_FULL_48_8]|uniref:Uncharacterized protein n=1 Tax=Candidatus Doudnabacteria bacterium RIFCSPHIGHO2_01_FULL_46_24 TaxID=1817825 RepID=A0A1F5NUZ7_9BACT|nr:MAG: hypothetical protein A2720_02490 [Candidatus Doudnabacteria bacterium RIFCSPHIGHO2_01_FULL_46_24]OGE94218.1 MAG: hypothetical protein A3E98_00135 [Candidatus Doudnabacteria bacterium RIFCSPHIGHO2_12_FULL_48_11]OGE95436.1 MAG: hypothetical protein A3H72_00755 [Candidatus Doudnabacteria bacterium RIFCSPLOWO2_02_FULL_48_8]